jgi:hypothetical protein
MSCHDAGKVLIGPDPSSRPSVLDVTILLLDEVAPGAGAANAKSPVATTTIIRVHTNTSEVDWMPRP